MTWVAPRERTRSSFAALATPVTSAPSAVAICTAYEPTPPEAPITRTFWPRSTRPTSDTAISAVSPEIGTAAACSKVTFAGLGASLSSRATAYSAKEPGAIPNTSSPTANLVTAEPTASTMPATSRPGTGFFGRRRPNARRAR